MAKRTKPKWTIMAYLAGDNDLPTFCISVLQQLEAVNYRDDICMLACFDSSTPWPKGSRYFAINCEHRSITKVFDWEIHNDLIPPNGKKSFTKPPDFCNPNGYQAPTFSRSEVRENLRRFVKWSMKNHKDSEKYMLILFGHGPIVAGQNFLVAKNPPSFLTLDDLQQVLGESFGGEKRKLDILAFQNCVMNGIEVAFELKEQVNLTIGSQGLVLATGWPYDKIINTVVNAPDAPPKQIAEEMLKVCARNMLDFSVMDRSSEQSVCDLDAVYKSDITASVKNLVGAMINGLDFTITGKPEKQVFTYPAICDAIRLARLEAQSYWSETFVDLCDFCERLLLKCEDAVKAQEAVLENLQVDEQTYQKFQESDFVKTATDIGRYCRIILNQLREFVPHSYYIGSELQYSRGLSIYFPWTLPAAPYFPVRVSGSKNFLLKTAFETYRDYSFVKDSEWAVFLETFFRATLRHVRRAPRVFDAPNNGDTTFAPPTFEAMPALLTADLAKSSPDTGVPDPEVWSNVKNYPRRNYLSPFDCPRKEVSTRLIKPGEENFKNPESPPVSAWGWNIAGLVAEVIQKKPDNARPNGQSEWKAISGSDSLTKAAVSKS